MERRRDKRISVSLKAALLNDKTLPRGCRVRDFSPRGMLLQYEYDGNAASFDDGDTVTVRLSLRQADERKVLTLPSTVRRVDQNGIGVEFQRRETQLLELLEPCRLDRQRAQASGLEQDLTSTVNGAGGSSVTRLATPARARHRGPRTRPVVPLPGATDRVNGPTASAAVGATATQPTREPAIAGLTDRGLYYVGLVSLVCAILILIIDFADNSGLKSRLSVLEASNRNHASVLSEMRERYVASGAPGQTLTELNARVETLAVSLATLEGRLVPAEPGRSAAAAGTPATPQAQSDMVASREPVLDAAAAAAHALREVEAALDEPLAGDDGPWRINLVSLYDKAAADRFVATAESKGVRVDQNQVMVKGREVWRLQISGFATQQEARAYGATAQDKLGLEKEVWVFKR